MHEPKLIHIALKVHIRCTIIQKLSEDIYGSQVLTDNHHFQNGLYLSQTNNLCTISFYSNNNCDLYLAYKNTLTDRRIRINRLRMWFYWDHKMNQGCISCPSVDTVRRRVEKITFSKICSEFVRFTRWAILFNVVVNPVYRKMLISSIVLSNVCQLKI